MSLSLGVYTKGEVPIDGELEFAFLYRDGTPIPLTGMTAKTVVTKPDNTTYEGAATVYDVSAGRVLVHWSAQMTDQAGPWSMTIWVGNAAGEKMSSPVIYYNVTDEATPTFS